MSRITRNTIGMFDCLKGVVVLFVILSHCFIEVWTVNRCTDYTLVWRCVHSMSGMAMGIFFIISGYGFRPVKNLRGVRMQARLLLRPVLTAYLCFTPAMMLGNLLTGEPVLSGIAERWTGFLLGHMRRTEMFGMETETLGVFWYFIALFIGWMLLTLIFRIAEKEAFRGAAVAVCTAAGCLLARFLPELWFCIAQGLLSVGFLYTGYLLKKNGLAFAKIPVWGYVLLVGAAASVLAFGYVNLGVNELRLGLLDYGGTVCGSVLLIRLYLRFFDPERKVYAPLMFLGRNSSMFICIHGFEALLILWRSCPYLISGHVQLTAFAFFAFRLGLITVLYYIAMYSRMLWHRMRTGRDDVS